MTNINKCQNCGSYNMAVSNTREHGKVIWRTRRCLDCDKRVYTVELDRKDYDRLNGIVEMAEGMKDLIQGVRE